MSQKTSSLDYFKIVPWTSARLGPNAHSYSPALRIVFFVVEGRGNLSGQYLIQAKRDANDVIAISESYVSRKDAENDISRWAHSMVDHNPSRLIMAELLNFRDAITQRIDAIEKSVQDLHMKLDYAPGAVGYEEAKQHFKTLKKRKRSNDDKTSANKRHKENSV